MAKILVAYDGSEMSKTALKQAKDIIAIKPDTEIHVATVITMTGPTMNYAIARSITEEIASSWRENINRLQAQLEEEEIHSQCEVIVDYNQRNAGIMACQYATENDIDMIIVGSRGLGAMKGLLLGSVSHYIVQHATCKVLVIK